MSKKYEIKICSCGRIHAIPEEKIDQAIESEKDLLVICGGCGTATLIGADVVPDFDNPSEDCYEMYARKFVHNHDKSIVVDSFNGNDEGKAISEIYYSNGYKVPMMTGNYATDYLYERFSDKWYPDFYKIERKDITVSEIMEFINNYKHDRKTVNMPRFIDETPDEILEELSNSIILAFDWKGTKFEKEWHK